LSEEHEITKSGGVVAGLTMVSRVFGLIRDSVAAHAFGANWVADSFYLAFVIPNMLRKLAGEGSLTISFIPVFTEELEKKGREEAMKLAYTTFWVALIFLTAITVVGMILASPITRLIAPGFANVPNKLELASKMTFEMFPYTIMICMTALCMGILNSFKHFAMPAANQIFFNIVSILAILIINNRYNFWHPGVALVVGVLVGGVVQFLVQVPPLLKRGFHFKPYLDWHHPGLKRIGKIMIPSIFGASIYQINVVVSAIFVSGFEGGRSWIYYADRIIELPRAIFGTAVATVILPNLSVYSARDNKAGFVKLLTFGLKLSAFLIVPSSVGLYFLRVPIISILFQRGQFTPDDTLKVAFALLFYTLALWATAGARIMTQSFYAMKDARNPALYAGVGMVANVIGCATLTRVPALGFAGVAVSTSFAAVLNFICLYVVFERNWGSVDLADIFRTVLKCLIACVPMSVISIYASSQDLWLQTGHIIAKILWMSGAIGASMATYFGIAWLMKMDELKPLLAILERKIK